MLPTDRIIKCQPSPLLFTKCQEGEKRRCLGQMDSSFNQLFSDHSEIAIKLLATLSINSLCCMQLTCRVWKRIIDDSALLKNFKLHLLWQNPHQLLAVSFALFKEFNAEERNAARLVCRQWKLAIERVQIAKNYNSKLMDAKGIRQEATYYSLKKSPLDLSEDQKFLLSVVKMATYCPNMQTAAANALMILKKNRFRFVGSDLRGIQVPGVRLPRTFLDEADLRRANLRGADLSDCSLNGTLFDGADLRDVQLGQLPQLNHEEAIEAMALAPHGQQIASISSTSIYLWNLKTFELQHHRNNAFEVPDMMFEKNVFLPCFSPDSQWLYLAHSEGKIEIWQCDPLEKVDSLHLPDVRSFAFLALTHEGKYLVSVANKFTDQLPFCSTIYLWAIALSEQGSPYLTLVKEKSCEGDKMHCSLASQALLLAMGNSRMREIHLYPLPNLEEIKIIPLKQGKSLSQLLFASNEKFLFIAQKASEQSLLTETEIEVWEIEKAKKVASLSEKEDISDWQFMPHSQKLAYITPDGTFCVRDGAKQFRDEVREKLAHLGLYRDTRFWLANDHLYQFIGNQIVALPLQKLKVRKETGLKTAMQIASFASNNGIFYAADHEGKIYHYHPTTGKKGDCKALKKVSRADGVVKDLAFRFSPDANYILQSTRGKKEPFSTDDVARHPTKFHSFSLFQVQDQIEKWGSDGNFLACNFSQDVKYLMFAREDGLELWDIASQEQLAFTFWPCPPIQLGLMNLTLSHKIYPEGMFFTIEDEFGGSKLIKIWQVNWERQVAKPIKTFESIQTGHFTDELLLMLREPNTIALWDCQSDEEGCIELSGGQLDDFAITANGTLMVTTQLLTDYTPTEIIKQAKISLWDIKQKEILDEKLLSVTHDSDSSIRSVFMSAQGQYVTFWEVNPTFGLQKLYVWEIKEKSLHFLWKMPKCLEANGINFKNVPTLSRENAQLIAQLQGEA